MSSKILFGIPKCPEDAFDGNDSITPEWQDSMISFYLFKENTTSTHLSVTDKENS